MYGKFYLFSSESGSFLIKCSLLIEDACKVVFSDLIKAYSEEF